MLIKQQFNTALELMKFIEIEYSELIFKQIGNVEMSYQEARETLRNPPKDGYIPISNGTKWGGEHKTGWFLGKAVIPLEYADKKVYLRAETGAIETLFFIDNKPKGLFAHKIIKDTRGNHHSAMLKSANNPKTEFDVALESYCWHNFPRNHPHSEAETDDRTAVFEQVSLLIMNDDIKDFVFDLKILNQLSASLPDDFRRAEIQNTLMEVFRRIIAKPAEREESEWRPLLKKARAIMKPTLEKKNPASAPKIGLIGHSHMDTAWLWTVDETIRKCARTYSNALSLMEQYPEYTFVQSSAYHGELMRRYYPSIYEEMKERVKEGRYEPNGGVWVECDCNLVSGESMIRQFLWGQRWTMEHFGYKSNAFWLPDTFGYSAAIPQIMKGCGVDYFLTTKLSWNETNEFPHDTFYWRGIDGTQALTHFNNIHCTPEPSDLLPKAYLGGKHSITDKKVSDMKLVSYGYGDGGGGPSYDMVESAVRLSDIEGCPKASHTTVGKFMKTLEETSRDIPVYSGELYVEGHRGTLTTNHNIKQLNRFLEFALRDIELTNSMLLTQSNETADIKALFETMMVNQFHDILPGTCIEEQHKITISQNRAALDKANIIFADNLKKLAKSGNKMSIFNSLSWERDGYYIDYNGFAPKNAKCQLIETISGDKRLYVSGAPLTALGISSFDTEEYLENGVSPFKYDQNSLETPFLRVKFDDLGYISSLTDKKSGRELRKQGKYPLNALLITQDVPLNWDNWNIDAYSLKNYSLVDSLLERNISAEGALQFRIRSKYKAGSKSAITQDMVFYADKARIDFETVVDWREKHTLLKAGFDIDVLADTARHEIQFGFTERPTYKKNSYEEAMFEVSNHRYTDLSEGRFGASLLNNCKYGISADGTFLGLSLLKSGTHPDTTGDEGIHGFTYSILPHGGFCAENTVRQGYELNVMPRVSYNAGGNTASFASVDSPNVIIETIKPAEALLGIILRLYECEKSGAYANLTFGENPKKIYITNMLEETISEASLKDGKLPLYFKPFEIKTIKVIF